MAFPIIPRRRSGTSGNPSSLFVGELAVNTHDGSLYMGADAGVVQIGVPVAAGTTVTEHTGDGTATAFTFSGYNGTADGGYIVSVGGIDQPPSVYSVSDTAGGTLTFNAAPASGEIVSIRALIAGINTGGGSANTGDITFSGTSINGVASNTALNNIELHPNPAYDGYGQFVVIRPTSPLEGNHIHIDKGGINASLFLGSDDQYVNLAWDGSIELGVPLTQTTQSYTMEFTVSAATSSMLITRSSNLWAINLTNGSTITRVSPTGDPITISTASVYGDYIYVTFTAPINQEMTVGDSVSFTYHPRKTWKFTNDGKMTFPDGSQQSTAGGGGGGGGTSIGGQIWDVAATYKQGDIVTTSQRDPAWICIQNDNTGHDPTGAPLWWQPLPADAVSLQLRPVATTAPTTGQVLTWNGTEWAPATISGGGSTAGTVTYTTVGQHYFSVPSGVRWARLQAVSGAGSAGTNGVNGQAGGATENGANGADGIDGTDGAAIWVNGSLLLSGGEKGLKGYGGGGGGYASEGQPPGSGSTGNGPFAGIGGTGGDSSAHGAPGNGGGSASPGSTDSNGGGVGANNGGSGGEGGYEGNPQYYGGGGGGGDQRSGGGGGGGLSAASIVHPGSGGGGGSGTAGASGSSMDTAFNLTSFAGSNLLIEIKPGAGSPSITFTW
jgi:hypothetical protein